MTRTVITDEEATHFGIPLKHRSIAPDENRLLVTTHFECLTSPLNVEALLNDFLRNITRPYHHVLFVARHLRHKGLVGC